MAPKNGTRCHLPGVALLSLFVLTAFPLVGRTKKGDEYLKEGARAELREDHGAALQLYEYALEEDSSEPT